MCGAKEKEEDKGQKKKGAARTFGVEHVLERPGAHRCRARDDARVAVAADDADPLCDSGRAGWVLCICLCDNDRQSAERVRLGGR